MTSVFPAELPDRPGKTRRLTLTKQLSQRLSSKRSERVFSTPVPLSTANAASLTQTRSHDLYTNQGRRGSQGNEHAHSRSQHTAVKGEGFVPWLKHAVSSLKNSKGGRDQDSHPSQSYPWAATTSDSLPTAPQPSHTIRRRPVPSSTILTRQGTLIGRFAGPGTTQQRQAQDDEGAQPLSPSDTLSPQPQSPATSNHQSQHITTYRTNLAEYQMSMQMLSESPAQSQPGQQLLHQAPHQSGSNVHDPIFIDDDNNHDVQPVRQAPTHPHVASFFPCARTQALSLAYNNLGSPSIVPAHHPMSTSFNPPGQPFLPAPFNSARYAWPTRYRRGGRFIDSRDAVALQEQLDRHLAEQLQQEEIELDGSQSCLMVPVRLEQSPSADSAQNEKPAPTTAGSREAPIDLDPDGNSSDTDTDTDTSGTITPSSTISIRPQAVAGPSRRSSDEMDWQPSSPGRHVSLQIYEDATLARLLQDEEDQQAAPVTRECPACSESCLVCELPSLAKCTHPPQTCPECFTGWIAAQLEGSSWQTAKCPESKCNVQLNYHEIQQLASLDTFHKYDTFITRAACNDDPLFRWCSKCSSGQIHDSTSATGNIFTCFSCSNRVCTIHENTWHEGETCDEYEYRTSGRQARDQRAQEEASKAAIDKLSKKCPGPGCVWRIQKNDGCDHMTCSKCRYEFCWICLCDYNNVRRIGNAAHEPSCNYHADRLY